jgi:hypothetical protein
MLNPIASCFVLASIFSQSKYNEEPYICPPLANYIDAPLPQVTTSDQLVGIYLNILYPEDNEKLQKKKLADWIESFGKNSDTPFPFSSEEINDLAIYILNEFPLNISRRYFAEIIHQSLADGYPLETALVNAKEKTLHRSLSYQ